MVLIAFQPEITRLDLLQPIRLILARLGKRRHAVADHQLRRFQRLALELLVLAGRAVGALLIVVAALTLIEGWRSLAG